MAAAALVDLRLVLYFCGWVAALEALALMLPALVSLIWDDGRWPVFVQSALAAALVAALFIAQGWSRRRQTMRSRGGVATVAFTWLTVSFLGALPYGLDASFPTVWDCLFESVSGFSATGASVARDVEALPASILFWRALTHWLGGMGIIVLMLAVLPLFGLNGVQLLKNEQPALGQHKVRPRAAETAKLLWLIYLGFTTAAFAVLLSFGMTPLDALCHSLSVTATGGFTNKNDSMAGYDASIQAALVFFMILASLNFTLYCYLLKGDFKSFKSNTEAKVFLALIGVAGVLACLPLLARGVYESGAESLGQAVFQVVSIATTTGFSSTDWERWPFLAQAVLLALFFVGGCSGSTSGGIKCIRWILIFKGIYRSLRLHLHRRAILPLWVGRLSVPETVVSAVWSFAAVYVVFLFGSTLALTALEVDIFTALCASASALGNVGQGLGEVGPADGFGALPAAAKLILCFDMILGRLEFFTLLILCLPEFWKK